MGAPSGRLTPHVDAPLETLLLPFRSGRLSWPQSAMFLRARSGAGLDRPLPGWVCEQTFKPEAIALEQAGFRVAEEDTTSHFPVILVLPPRQRDEARALMARAVTQLVPGGIVVAAAGNNEGARSHEADLGRLGGPLTNLTKHKCRVFWTTPLQGPADLGLLTEWRELDAIRPIGDGTFVSRPGVFAWDRIDPASRLLAEHLPGTLRGNAADLGAGFGYLSLMLLDHCPGITAIDLFEAEKRALDLARLNVKHEAARFYWHDVTTGLPGNYDVIVMNPPFHTQGQGGRGDRPDIGRRFIAVAAEHLKPGGSLWLVANRHLAYESVLDANFGTVAKLAEADGFKVIHAIKSGAAKR